MWQSGVHYDTEEIFSIIEQYNELPAGEQTRLARLAQAGDTAARDMLILTNLRLVAAKVKPWMTSQNIEDVIHEGIIGMCQAIDKFDPDKGFVFSTYAVPWIQNAARLWSFAQNKLYVSRHVNEAAISIKRCLASGVSDPQMIAEQTKMKLEHVQHAMSFAQVVYPSLDRNVHQTRSEPLGYFIQDKHDHFESILNAIDIERWLAVLDERERQIVSLRVGLRDDDDGWTFLAIAKHLGLTPQRIMQIYAVAIKKLQRAAGVKEAKAS